MLAVEPVGAAALEALMCPLRERLDGQRVGSIVGSELTEQAGRVALKRGSQAAPLPADNKGWTRPCFPPCSFLPAAFRCVRA